MDSPQKHPSDYLCIISCSSLINMSPWTWFVYCNGIFHVILCFSWNLNAEHNKLNYTFGFLFFAFPFSHYYTAFLMGKNWRYSFVPASFVTLFTSTWLINTINFNRWSDVVVLRLVQTNAYLFELQPLLFGLSFHHTAFTNLLKNKHLPLFVVCLILWIV